MAILPHATNEPVPERGQGFTEVSFQDQGHAGLNGHSGILSSDAIGIGSSRPYTSAGFFQALVPSFLQHERAKSNPNVAASSSQKLSHLDGLRGIAALVVFFCHMGYSSHDLSYGYGYIGERSKYLDNYRSPFRLPIVRLFYDGDAAVCLFFIISGFSLSLKPIRQARARDMAGFANTLTSSTLRRGIRLFLPLATSLLCIAVLVQMGAYNLTNDIANNGVLLTAFREPHPVRSDYGNIFRELGHWAYLVFDFVQPWHWARDPIAMYDIHLWTIPVEFRASLALFVLLFGVAKMQLKWRRRTVAAVAVLGLAKDNYVMTLFSAGLWFAESHLIAEAEHGPPAKLPSHSPSHQRKDSREYKKQVSFFQPRTSVGRLLLAATYFVTLFLMSQPFFGEETLFWRTLLKWVPNTITETKRFYTTIGCILFFLLSTRSPFFLAIYRSRLAQYLGRISFSLYLVHACVLHTVGYATFATVWSFTGIGEEGYGLLRREVGFVIACLFITPVTIWVADVFTRLVDEPCVRLARRVEQQICS